MFGIFPGIAGLAGSLLGGLFGQNNHCHNHHGHHHHHGAHGHHHHHHTAADDFRMAREDFRDAQQDFSRGDFFGGMQELSEANQHMADGYSHLAGRSWL